MAVGTKTNYFQTAILNHLRGGTAWTQPAALYVALLTADTDGEIPTVTEVTGGAYARQAVTFGAVTGNNTIANTNLITFPAATAGWGTVTHYAIYDASTAGNPYWTQALSASKTIATTDQPTIAIGALVYSED